MRTIYSQLVCIALVGILCVAAVVMSLGSTSCKSAGDDVPKTFEELEKHERINKEDTSRVAIYKPDKCYNGYTVFSYEVGPKESRIIDMNGRILNQWDGRHHRAEYLKNDHVLLVGGGPVRELDWDGNLVWEYAAPDKSHHDAERLANGNTVFLYREFVPVEYTSKSKDPERAKIKLFSDVILEVTAEKEIAFQWHQYKYFDIDWYKPKTRLKKDWTHTNTVQSLPANKWYDAGDKRFKPGNYLISLRALDTILIVDRDTGQIVWQYSGDYKGGLSGQHEPNMIKKGLSGAGNILIFDNGVEETHTGSSIILEINPVTLEVVWTYEDECFYSPYRSTVQRLPNGNTFICEADHKRMIEVRPDGEIVWEYFVTPSWRVGRAQRIPYDFTARLKSLKKSETDSGCTVCSGATAPTNPAKAVKKCQGCFGCKQLMPARQIGLSANTTAQHRLKNLDCLC